MNRRQFMASSLAGLGGAMCSAPALMSARPAKDRRLKGAFRKPQQAGWTLVHLEGSPDEIGYQHGYLLAPEIDSGLKVVMLEQTHGSGHDWAFFRHASKHMIWPHTDPEYREEMTGIAHGLKARGLKWDIWDVVALNTSMEWGYYLGYLNKRHRAAGEHCSAFVATGDYTSDGKVIIAHNNWTDYLDGERWTILYDIAPAHGYRIFMDAYPGFIHSGDDFGINSAGLAITETTISHFSGYDPSGIPEFVRARKAMQYSASIDDYVRIMKKGNNGGYANNWLIADSKANEVADLELGLKNVSVWRTKNGCLVGSNFPVNEKLAEEETNFDLNDKSNGANARHIRWNHLMKENKGRIDLAAAQKFLGDHYDTYDQKDEPDERTLCGHIDMSSRGARPWQPPYGPAGAVQNKAADSSMIQQTSLSASAGHCCGMDFKAAEHVKEHPEFSWQEPLLHDMNAYPWTNFKIAKS